MKAKEVLELLDISRVTLWSYLKKGKIKATKMENNNYDYDEESVYKLLGKMSRKDVIYARVSTIKQKKDLFNQIKHLENFIEKLDIKNYDKFSEIGSGMDLERKEFKKLLDEIYNYRIRNIYITNKDRLTRLSFVTLEEMFKRFGTNIVVINDIGKDEDNDKEILQELMSLMHYFSMKMYSKRRKENLLKLKKSENLKH